MQKMLINLDSKMDEIATSLNLKPHPEGGYFRETYRSVDVIDKNCLPSGFSSARNLSTAIYFLIGLGNFSAFHRILSDEMWHFYVGEPLHIHEIKPDGTYKLIKLGLNFSDGYEPQAIVPAHSWFASECATPKGWSLVGCTVSPGFDFTDFELAERKRLISKFPEQEQLITRLTR